MPQRWQVFSPSSFQAPQTQRHRGPSSRGKKAAPGKRERYSLQSSVSPRACSKVCCSGRLSQGWPSASQMLLSEKITCRTWAEKPRVLASGKGMGSFCPNSLSRGALRSRYWCSTGSPRGRPRVSRAWRETVRALMGLICRFLYFTWARTWPVTLSFRRAPAMMSRGAFGVCRFPGRENSLI